MFVVINYIPIARNCLAASINSQHRVAGTQAVWCWGALIHQECGYSYRNLPLWPYCCSPGVKQRY